MEAKGCKSTLFLRSFTDMDWKLKYGIDWKHESSHPINYLEKTYSVLGMYEAAM
jgi:hypothetical protein